MKKTKKTKKFGLKKCLIGVLILSIGISYTVVYYEAKALVEDYNESMMIIDEYFDNKDNGSDVQAIAQVTPEEKTYNQPDEIGEIVAKVYRLESSGGKNDSCKNKGLYNGYGYAQNKFAWNCYESHEEVTKLVEDWFIKNLEDKTIAEALCYYNEGIIKSKCDYYSNYLKL